jgi:hypothetical protein
VRRSMIDEGTTLLLSGLQVSSDALVSSVAWSIRRPWVAGALRTRRAKSGTALTALKLYFASCGIAAAAPMNSTMVQNSEEKLGGK